MNTPTVLAPLDHPGPVAEQRLESVPGGTVTVRVSLPPGRRLVDAIDDELTRIGADSAQVELLGGPLARVSYCIPAVCTDGSRAAWYSETYEAATPVTIVGGSATVGRRDGERFMHCHAAWHDARGVLRGGHLWPDTVVGATPVEIVLHAFDSVALTSGVDDETLMPVFTPSATAEPVVGNRRSVMTRVRPGVEIHETVRRVMAEHGIVRASVRGSLGSLVGATLLRDGGAVTVDGPATEVALAGHAERGGPAYLSALVMDRHGEVHVGELAERGNLVAVTFELFVEEIA
ncbi:PCC domain-containing protein [Rhodococcus sp. NPDC003318]|uniref:PCC domain-containing protein n=1 Tax=Rhodococcus sp. NPDC003318 TaxID=3364503 RepID=UPI0036C41D5C